MGQFMSQSTEYDPDVLSNKADELYSRFMNAVQDDDRQVQKKSYSKLRNLLDTVQKQYPGKTLMRHPEGHAIGIKNTTGPEPIQESIIWYDLPIANTTERVVQDKALFKKIKTNLLAMETMFNKQENTTHKRRFIYLNNNGTNRKQRMEAKRTRRILQHHKAFNQPLRYGYKNTTRRYKRNYNNEYVTQKADKKRREHAPTVVEVAEQVAEQTVPGMSIFGWIQSFFGSRQPQQQQQQQQQQQSQQSQQSQQRQPSSPSINSEIMTATEGDRKAYNRLLNLKTDERKRELLNRYLEIKQIGDERDRNMAFIDFYSRFGDGASSAASTSTPSRTTSRTTSLQSSTPTPSRPTSLRLPDILASAKKIYEWAMKKLTIPSKNNSTKVSLKKPIVENWDTIIKSTLLNLGKALDDAKKRGDPGNVIQDYKIVINKLQEGIKKDILKKRSASRMKSIQEGEEEEGEEEEETSREETSREGPTRYASAVHRIIPTAIDQLENDIVRRYLLSIEYPDHQQAELARFLAIVNMPPGTEERNQAFQDFYTARRIQSGKRKLLHPR